MKIFKHIILALSIAATAAVVLAVQVVLLSNTDMAQKQARQIINGIIPGSITWEYLSVSPLTGRVEIRKAVLAGEDRRTIARFDRLTARISIPSALRGKLDIAGARVERPECFLELDDAGRLNIVKALGIRPKKKKPDRKPARLPGFLLVRRCVLIQGSFGFSRPAVDFNLEIRDISCAAGLDFATETGTIDLTVGKSFFTVRGRRTDVRHLALESAVRVGIAERLRLKLQTTASDIAIRGDIRDLFRNPAFDVNAAFSLSLAELRDILNASRPLDGTVSGAFTAKGTVNNPSISFTARYTGGTILGSPVGAADADLAMADRVVSIAGIRAFSGAGHIDLRGAIDMRNAYPAGFIRPGNGAGRISYAVVATSRGFSLRSIPGLGGRARGLIDGHCALSGTGFAPGSASATLDVQASVPDFAAGEKGRPARLALRARAVMSEGVIRVSGAEALLGNALFRAGGSYTAATTALRGSFSLASTDIAPESACLGFENCSGKADVNGSLSGTLRRPLVTAGLTAAQLRFWNIMFGSLAAQATIDENGTVAVERFTLTNRESMISLRGGAALFDEGFALRPDPAVSLEIDRFEVEAGNFLESYGGRCTLTGRVGGTLLNPAGSLAAAGEGIDLGFQKFHSVNCSINFRDRRAWIEPILVTVAPGETIRCGGWIGTDRSYDLTLLSDPISLTGIQAINTSAGLRGRLLLDLKGSGSLGNPSLEGSLAATKVSLNDTAISDMAVKLSLRNRRIAVKGTLNFDIDAAYDFGKRRFTVAALFDKTDLAPYLSAAGRKNLGGVLSGTIRAEGSAAAPEKSNLAIRLTQFDLTSGGERLVRSAMFDASLRGGIISIPGIRLALLDTGRLTVSGRGDINSRFSVDLDGFIPLDLANRFTDSLTNFSGNLIVTGGMTGTRTNPRIDARVAMEEIGFSIPAIGNDVRALNGGITFSPGRIVINDIRGLMGRGKFGIRGAMGIRGLKLHDIGVEAMARNVPVDIPDMMHMTFDANARITGSGARSLLSGDFTLVDGVYYQDLALHPLQEIGMPVDRKPKHGGEKGDRSILDTVAMNVTVASRRPFAIENNIASLRINTDLQLIGTLKKPILRGSARVESGVVHYLGRDFDITRGKIDFINPYRIDPVISIGSNARIQKWLVSIAVSGTPAALRYDLSSSPVLDSNNILSLILLGKTTGGAATYSTTDLLGQVIAFNYGGQIKKSTGIDTIEVKTRDAQGKGSFKGQMVTFGKYLDRRFSVYYSIGKDNREIRTGSAVRYKLNDSVLMNIDYDSKGNVGIDMQYNKEFR